MTQQSQTQEVVVLCTKKNGSPVFHTCRVPASDAAKLLGTHHLLAKQDAAAKGFEGPMMAFDSIEQALVELGDIVSRVSEGECVDAASFALMG